MFLLLFAIIIVLFVFHQCYWRLRNLPRGPIPLPGLGNILALSKSERWEDTFLEWRNKYGNIYTYWMGPMPVISVNDYNTAVEMFVKDGETYAERYVSEAFFKAVRGGVFGIIATSGDLWKQQRRFSLKVLRDFGLGKNKMQERILEEMQTICENVNRDINSGIIEHDFHKHTDLATGSVINAIVCGFKFSANGKEKEFYKLKDMTARMTKIFSDPLVNMAVISSFFTNFPLIKPKYQNVIALFKELRTFLNNIIDDHIKNNDYSTEIEPQDFIDAYLSEMHRANERKESHYFSNAQLMNIVLDLWFAGQETTSSTLTWGLAYLIRYPDVQKRMQDELDKVIGSERMITVSDKQQLPYTNAVIMEIQRVSNIVANNFLHKTSRDIEINGKIIPKGTIIVPQISVIMRDPKVFKDPKEFNPSRFIDESGNFKPADEVVPFSMGKRQCAGESLARMELFLFISNIINQYKLSPAKEPPTLKKNGSGVSFSTQPYKCCVERRF